MSRKNRKNQDQGSVGRTVSVIIGVIPTVIFLAFIYYMMVRSFTGEVKEAVTETELSIEGLETLSDSFEGVLSDNFYDKYSYINLNGLTTKILGINSLNDRQKLANGYLTYFEDVIDNEYASAELIELNDFLSDRDIPFLYILAPTKASFYDDDFAPGYGSDAWENIDSLIDALDASGVDNFDMDAWFEENGWTMEDTFFKTDHHWLPQAGFQTTKLYMGYLAEQGLAEYDPETLNEENWDITVYEDWFLGSHGKRTGTTYAGVDDFALYIPKYETNYSYSYLRSGTTNWTYTDNPLNLDYFDETDYFNISVHGAYLGGDYPIRKITNTEAYNPQKILVLGDSFRRPFEYFLTTQFREVYGVDLRHYTDGTLAQYIEEIQPDLVVMCAYEHSLTTDEALYTFGVEEYLEDLGSTDPDVDRIELGDFAVAADEGSDMVFSVVCSNLEPGQTYTLTLDSTRYSGGEDQYVQMTLQDISSNKAVVNRYFDADSDASQKWIFTVPEGSDTYAIYFYAGTKGHTANVRAEADGVELRKGIYEQ